MQKSVKLCRMLHSIQRFHQYTRVFHKHHPVTSFENLSTAWLLQCWPEWSSGSLPHKESSLSLLVYFCVMFLDPQVLGNKLPSIPSIYDSVRNFSNVPFSMWFSSALRLWQLHSWIVCLPEIAYIGLLFRLDKACILLKYIFHLKYLNFKIDWSVNHHEVITAPSVIMLLISISKQL